MKHIYLRIEELLNERGISKNKICKDLDIPRGNFNRYCRGDFQRIPLNEVLYFETVDKKTFIYTQQKVFECKKLLSVIEQDLITSNIVRISKTVLLNISYLACVKPYPNHRLLVELNNKENLIVSRTYIPILQDKIRSGYYE